MDLIEIVIGILNVDHVLMDLVQMKKVFVKNFVEIEN